MNLRPLDPQSSALPSCATPRFVCMLTLLSLAAVPCESTNDLRVAHIIKPAHKLHKVSAYFSRHHSLLLLALFNRHSEIFHSMDVTALPNNNNNPQIISLRQALPFWLKLGFISFGGPAGQIAIMHRELVEQRRWISEKRFLHALNYCMLLPGPEAQ